MRTWALGKSKVLKSLIAGVLATALILPLSGCRRSSKKEDTSMKYASGKEIKETDPFFLSTINEIKFPTDKDKEVDALEITACEIIDGYAVVAYDIYYKIPQKEDADVMDYVRDMQYYHKGISLFDMEGNYVRDLTGDVIMLYDVASDKDGNICTLCAVIDPAFLKTFFQVQTVDREGNFVRTATIMDPPILDPNADNVMVITDDIAPDPNGFTSEAGLHILDDGTIVVIGQGKMCTYQPNGVKLFEISDPGRYIDDALIQKGNKYQILSVKKNVEAKNSIQIKSVDFKTGKLGSGTDAEDLGRYDTYTTADGYIFETTASGCNRYDPSTKKLEEVFNWNDTDVDRTKIGNLRFTPVSEDEYYAVGLERLFDTMKAHLVHLTRAEKNPHAGKKYIVIGGLRINNEELLHYTNEYNRDPSAKARAVIVDYADGLLPEDPLGEVQKKLYLDIISGSGPDVLMNVGDMEAFQNGNVMEDMNPFLDGANGIDRKEYFDNVLRACEREGKLYHVPARIRLRGFLVNSDMIPYTDGWTFDEFEDAKKNIPNDVSFMEGIVYNDYLKILLLTTLPRFLSYENKKVDIQNEDMKKILIMAKENGVERIPEDEETRWVDEGLSGGLVDYAREKFNEGLLAVKDKDIGALQMISTDTSLCGGHVAYLGYPAPEKNGLTVIPKDTMGIVASSKNKDLAWEFIRHFLTYEMQVEDADTYGGIPVNRALFETVCQKSMEQGNATYDDLAAKIGLSEMKRLADAIPRVESSDIDILRDLMEHANVSVSTDSAVFAIICEEAAGYFAGDRTIDEVLKTIENRAKTVVFEY